MSIVIRTNIKPSNVRHLIYGLNPLITMLREEGVDVSVLLQASDIPPQALNDLDYMLTPEQEMLFTELALECVSKPDIGLRMGQRYHLSAYGMLGLAIMTSPNLLEAFQVLFRNILMTYTYMHWKLHTEAEVAVISFKPTRDLGNGLQYMIDRGLAASYTIAVESLGKPLPLLEVNITQPMPNYIDSYNELFNCPINFNAKTNDFRFQRHFLDEPLLQSEMASAKVFGAQCERICTELSRGGSFVDLLRQHLGRLPKELASLDKIADHMCTTPRTIQRKLKAESTNFREQVETVRKNLSTEYLRSTLLSIEEIALRLGYNDASSFSHAYKRWTGKSPAYIRASLNSRD